MAKGFGACTVEQGRFCVAHACALQFVDMLTLLQCCCTGFAGLLRPM